MTKLTRALVFLSGLCLLAPGTALALTPFTDSFDKPKLNTSRWALKNFAKGKLSAGSGRMNFTVANPPTGDDAAMLTLRNNQPGFNESWEVVLDVTNLRNAGNDSGTGIWIYNATDEEDGVFLEFYGTKGGFNVINVTDDEDNTADDISRNPRVKSGSMRISFDKSTKLFTFWYDKTGSANGFKWVKICTFSPTGKGGDRNGDWKMNPGSGRFGVRLFGFAENNQKQAIPPGQISFDNFSLKAAK
jgi:hypothetical protein